MPEKIEEALKTLHLFLNACDKYGTTDQLIVEKKEIFQLLEKLNLAIYDSMDDMKMTQHQQEEGEKAAQRQADELIEHAAYNAEEVYAASLIYTDDALDKLKEIIEKNNEIIQEEYQSMVKQMEERMSAIDYNQSELRKQLMDMYQNDFYIKLLNSEKEKYYARRAARMNSVMPPEEMPVDTFYRDELYPGVEGGSSPHVLPQREVPEIRVNEEHIKVIQKERGVNFFREETEKIRVEEQARKMAKEKARLGNTNPFLKKIREEARRDNPQEKGPSIMVNQKHLQQVIREREAYERKHSTVPPQSDAPILTPQTADQLDLPLREATKTQPQKETVTEHPAPSDSGKSTYQEMEMEDIQEGLKETIQSLANMDFNFDLSRKIEHETEAAITKTYEPTSPPSKESQDARWTGYGKASAFSNEALDAEYEKWKAEHVLSEHNGN